MTAFTDTIFGVTFYYEAYSHSKFLLLCESIGFSVIKYVVVNEPDGLKQRIGVVLTKT